MKLIYKCPKCDTRITMLISPSQPPTCSHKDKRNLPPAVMVLDDKSEGKPSYEKGKK